MSATRQTAMRLALYLDCIGVKPLLIGNSYKEYRDALRIQYQSIEPGLRKEGRTKGRKLIRETEGLDRVACHLVPVLPPAPLLPLAQDKIAKWRLRSENYKRKALLWPPETPPCPKCKMWAGLPKRSWPSRKSAEKVRLRQRDPMLRVYECPVQPGFWHLGHRRIKSQEPSVQVRDGELTCAYSIAGTLPSPGP
jgi:hypothetical protein